MVIEALSAGVDFMISMVALIWNNTYALGGIFSIPIGLWVLDKVFGLFDIIKP